MQGYRESDHIFCGTEEFHSNYCMCIDKYKPCRHVYHGRSLWVTYDLFLIPIRFVRFYLMIIFVKEKLKLFCIYDRLEKVGVKSKAGQAKVTGTIICVGGALLLSFYHGSVVDIAKSSIHWRYAEKTGTKSSINHVNLILGPFLLILSAVSWAIWLIIQVSTTFSKYSDLKQ